MTAEACPEAVPVTRLRQRPVYRTPFATIYDDPVILGDGRRGNYLRVVLAEGQPCVAMLPKAGHLVALVRVYRYPLGAWEWGIPRGLAHGPDPAASARAELVEELGAAPAELAELGEVTPDSGTLASVVRVFLASYPAPVSAPVDRAEVAEVRWLPVLGLLEEIAAGRIMDGFTLAAVCVAACRGVLL